MLKQYFKIAIRNLDFTNPKVLTNIFGLTLGISCLLLFFIFSENFPSYLTQVNSFPTYWLIGISLILFTGVSFNIIYFKPEPLLHELALMRSFGAGKHGLFIFILIETLLLNVLAGILSLILIDVFAHHIIPVLDSGMSLKDSFGDKAGLVLIFTVLIATILVGLLPAICLSTINPDKALRK